MNPRKPDPTPGERFHVRADGTAKLPLTKGIAKRAALRHGPRGRVYRCPTCGWWHVAYSARF